MSNSEAKSGFLDKIFSILGRASDPEREKKRQLKELNKQLRKHKYKFYRPKQEEALSALAKFFYEIYSIVGPAKLLLDHAEASVVLKTIIIENTLTEKQLEMRASFEDSEIRAAVEESGGNVKFVTDSLKSDLVNFFSIFDTSRVQSINTTFNLMSIFLDFITFDYYFFLRKFDSRFPENDFMYNPRFEDINGEYIVEDLKDFLVLIPYLELDSPWDNLLDVLSAYKGTDIMNRKDWQKLLRKIRDVRQSKVLELMVKVLDKDPGFTYKVQRPSKRIVEDYLNKLKSQVELSIHKILKEQRNGKIDSLAKKIFGTNAVSRMKYYTEKANLAFAKKMLGGYIYIAPMNYLKAFLVDFCKKDIREISDILLIRGKWTTNISSQQLSEAFYGLMATSEELITFDENLSEEGDRGALINKLVKRRDADKSNITLLRKELKEVNNEALRLINVTGNHLVSIAKSFKLVYEDYQKKPHELITNWKEIEGLIDGGVVPRMTEIYKKCYYFVQLLQFYNKQSKK
ncbi:MAG: DUF5312 family protein [Spirochaetales bacterium]|uniref:DUF5312 family protein n=1 Tax=Candidatus Thalassospirochaeta sargassi TaxID=3119039 RepID=A0AAJ1IEX1_9SPIO|nr:DUF5312 family protein [Spirochaetales bacterium]